MKTAVMNRDEAKTFVKLHCSDHLQEEERERKENLTIWRLQRNKENSNNYSK